MPGQATYVRIVCGHLSLADCVAAVAAVPFNNATNAAETVIADVDCEGAVCVDPQPVSVAFIPFDWTVQQVHFHLPRTYQVVRTGTRPVASRSHNVGFTFQLLLEAVLQPDFTQPSLMAPSVPVVCGRVAAGPCATAIRDALTAHPEDASANGAAVEYSCPPGAFCSFDTFYAVALLVGTPSATSTYPPVFSVHLSDDNGPGRTTPWGGGPLLDYIAAVIRAAGWVTP